MCNVINSLQAGAAFLPVDNAVDSDLGLSHPL